MELCKKVSKALGHHAVEMQDDEKRNLYQKQWGKWTARNYRENVIKDAMSVEPIPTSAAHFDSDPYLFNCINGTLDLRSMTFHDHAPDDMLTKTSGVQYNPEARCPRWEQFIDEITCGDKTLGRYIQKALGYALTGITNRECLFILYGATTRNGKGTLCETMLKLMGDYGKTASPETLAQRKYKDSRGPTEDIARLAGARFVNMSEPDKSMVFNAALLKTLTGGDTISARFLNEQSFEFKPQFKIFINTNHLPRVDDSTVFSSGRIILIPFNRHFDEQERDPNLKATLTTSEALSGILNWCIQGYKSLAIDGLQAPQCVIEQIEGYKDTSDKTGQFIEDCLDRAPNGEVTIGDLYARYSMWCPNNGCYCEGKTAFTNALRSAGLNVQFKRPASEHSNPNATKKQIISGYVLRPVKYI